MIKCNVIYFFELLGIFFTAGLVTFGLIKFLSKRIFDNYLKKRLESHKSDLERLNISHQIQFSSLHKERAIIIKQLYFSLYDYKLSVMDFFDSQLDNDRPKEHLKHKLENWTNAVLNFSPLFHKNKIYFSKKQVEMINSINNEMEKINTETKQFLSSFEIIQNQITAIKNENQDFKELKKRSNILLENTFELEKNLENEFRKILGVEIK